MCNLQRTYDQFVPEFIGTLFGPGDMVRVAVLHGPGDMRNELLARDQAVARLLELQSTPNVYFACAALAPGGGYAKRDCVSTHAVCVDLDYGTVGHKAGLFFGTKDDAWSFLMTSPCTPTGVWHTGHGLQAVYLLDQPYEFRVGDQAERTAAYEGVSRTMAKMVQSDATFTPEHLFRVPLTVNAKPDTAPVQGALLHWNPRIWHSFAQLQAICAGYGVPDDTAIPQAVPLLTTADGTVTAYADLPAVLRDEIEMSHGNRSEAMFDVIVTMLKAGYAPTVIHDAIPHGGDFSRKYGNRLHTEIDRCLNKIHAAPHVYADMHIPLDVTNIAKDVPVSDCAPLTPEMAGMLERYSTVTGIALSERVRTAARFHEQLFQQQSGVMETPCGSGKSTWALCHIALNASACNRYLYVVDTIETLYRAADVIEKLTPGLSVGRYHSFNPERCQALCGTPHNWQQCNPEDPASLCRKCKARQQCAFFDRDRQLDRPVVVMCHNGFVRLLESEAAEPLLDRARIVIDEDLNAFLSTEFEHEDLQLVDSYVSGLGLSLKPFFPYTSFAASGTPYGIQPGALTYASIHYVYRNEGATSALSNIVTDLRKAIGTGRLGLTATTAQNEHARQLLYELLSFFRPGYRGDASYAYREIRDRNGVRYLVKKSRFNLGSQPVGVKLWILNASAQLSPYPANMPVYRCPDLRPNGHQLSLHVIVGSPMQSKHGAHVRTACEIIRKICLNRDHKAAFVATDKGATSFDDVASAVRGSFGEATRIVRLERGRIRGSNVAGDCTFACLAGLSLFTSIDNVGATAAIVTRRTIPVTPNVFARSGVPSMPGGRFKLKIMREIYALSAMDELYQTLWRTAVRNDGQVEAVVVVPDAEWLSILWRTVMPGFRTHAVYKPSDRSFKIDLAMDGLVFLMGVAPGREFAKQDIAKRMGYQGQNAWKDNAARIGYLLAPFFEDGSTNRMLRRKPVAQLVP